MTNAPAPAASHPSVARFRHRLLALVYDLLLLAAILLLLSLGVIVINEGEAVDAGTWWYRLLLLAATLFFYGWFWTHGGQTLGMKAWKIRLVGTDAPDVSWRRAGIRAAAGIAAWVPFAAGFLWMLVDRERLTLQDRMSATRVVDLR